MPGVNLNAHFGRSLAKRKNSSTFGANRKSTDLKNGQFDVSSNYTILEIQSFFGAYWCTKSLHLEIFGAEQSRDTCWSHAIL